MIKTFKSVDRLAAGQLVIINKAIYKYSFVNFDDRGPATVYTYNVYKRMFFLFWKPVFSFESTKHDECIEACKTYLKSLKS